MAILRKKPPVAEVLVVIVNRGKAEKVVKVLNNIRVDMQMTSLGKGSADSSMAEYFGLDVTEKEIVFAIIKLKDAEQILSVLNEKMKFTQKNTGLALTIPIKSATYNLLEQLGFIY